MVEKANFLKVGEEKDFQQRGYRCIRYLGRSLAVFKRGHEYFGLEVDCKHQNAKLIGPGFKVPSHGGPWEVTCPRHGWRYNLENGDCLTEPWARLRRYPVKIEAGTVFISTVPEPEE